MLWYTVEVLTVLQGTHHVPTFCWETIGPLLGQHIVLHEWCCSCSIWRYLLTLLPVPMLNRVCQYGGWALSMTVLTSIDISSSMSRVVDCSWSHFWTSWLTITAHVTFVEEPAVAQALLQYVPPSDFLEAVNVCLT